MAEQKQKMRFTDKELSIIKNTFSDNEDAVKVIRKVFLQMPLSALDEAIAINTFKGKDELNAVVRKTFLPTLDGEAPIFQVVDLWATIDLKDKTLAECILSFKSRELLISYIDQQLNKLSDLSTEETIKFADMIDFNDKLVEEAYINMVTRNTLINHVEQQLSQFTILAGEKTETVEQTKERLFKNSSK